MIPDVVETLQQLIRIPSVNPMGRDVTGEPYCEHALTDYLEQFFQDLGVQVCRQPVAPQRDNIMARIDAPAGDDQGSIVVFDVHQDTVPVDGMTIDPWEPRIDQGRVFGRGACDVKGAMACMLTAFARLAAERPPRYADTDHGVHRERRERFYGSTCVGAVLGGGYFADCFLVSRTR